MHHHWRLLVTAVHTCICSAGAPLNCTAELLNSGNVRLSNVSLSTASSISECSNLPDGLLWPDRSVNCTISIVSTQDDFEAGNMSWAVTATAIPSGTNNTLVTAAASGSVELTASPKLSLSMVRKATDGSSTATKVSAAGTVVQLVLTATNAGNVALYNLSLSVPGMASSLVCTGSLSVLHVGDALECSGNITYDQDALEAGTRNFTAIGTAANLAMSVSSEAVTVEVEASPALQLDVDARNCTKPTRLRKSLQ